jgi:hypothetical protein
MSNSSNQHSRQQADKTRANPAPDCLQGAFDSESEFSVNEAREERREDESQHEEDNAASPSDSKVAETQSEFSVDERLKGKS